MNLLEQYIKQIHSEEMIAVDWNDEGIAVKVDLTVNCYGQQNRTTQYFKVDEWEKVKENGYYMA